MLRSVISLLLLFSSTDKANAALDASKVQHVVESSFRFIVAQQKTDSQYPLHWAGEFPSFMENRKSIIALGPAHLKAPDSNCFTSVLMYEELSKLYPELRNKPEYALVMNRSFSNIMSFRYGNSFNFWHSLPRTDRMLRSTPKSLQQNETFRPNQYPLTNRFADLHANIANDADDTALAYSAILAQERFAQTDSRFSNPEVSPSDLAAAIDAYRDVPERGKQHPFNILHGNLRKTGGFLTWLSPEKIPFLMSPLRGWKANLRIPDGINNIDCVVNANILSAFSQSEMKFSPGYAAACAMVNDAVSRNLEKACGLYYPNPYSLHFAVGKALAKGAECLKPAALGLMNKLMNEQSSDGSFDGGSFNEPVQSTLFATHALINLSDTLNETYFARTSIDHAVAFIYRERIESPNGTSWPAGSYFSGGMFVRNLLSWKSEAFSTALGLSIFSRYQKMLSPVSHD